MKEQDTNSIQTKLVECAKEYLTTSRDVAREFQTKAIKTWDMINGKVDWSHKKRGQAKVHLNKVGVALERFKSQVKQGLLNFDEFLSVEVEPGMESELMSAAEGRRFIKVLTDEQNLRTSVVDLCGLGSVENLMAAKVRPEFKEIRGKKVLRICVDNLDIFTYYFDPHGDLYKMHEANFDKHELVKYAESQKHYYVDKIKALTSFESETEYKKDEKKASTIRNVKSKRRCNIVVHEIWGTFLDDNGDVLVWKDKDGELPLENVCVVLANEKEIIARPKKNDYFSGEPPFVAMSLLRDHKSPYKKGLMMHGVDLNWLNDELVSALVDAALKEAQNTNIVKVRGLEDPKQVSGGINYNQTILQNNSLAPGEKLIETIKLGSVPQGGFSVLSILSQDLAENVMSNEMNLTGGLASKQVRATEAVQSQQVVQSLADSINFDIDDLLIEALIRQIFCMGLQYSKYLSDDDLMYVFFGDETRAGAFKEATKSPKRIFDELAYAFKFKGRGIKAQVTNARNAQALTNFVSVMFSNPLMAQIMEREYSLPMIAGNILKGYGIDPEKITLTERERQFIEARQIAVEQADAMAQGMRAKEEPTGATPMAQPTDEVVGGSGEGVV